MFDGCLVSPEGSVVTSDDIHATFGSTVTISCSAEGGPNNVYEWRKQRKLISISPVQYFQNVTGCDGGNYQCTVINAAGSDTASTLLSGMHASLLY